MKKKGLSSIESPQIVEKLMFFYNLFYFHRNDDG